MKIQITDKSFPQALPGLGHRASVRFLRSPLVYPFLLVFALVSITIKSSGVTAVSAGDFHSLYLKSDGSLWASGLNSSGQLGDGTNTNRNFPVQIELSGVTAIAAGASTNPSSTGGHSLYVRSDGSLWAMGSNIYGQLGDGTTTNRSTPVQIETSGVTSVHAGYDFSLYIKSDGSLSGDGV